MCHDFLLHKEEKYDTKCNNRIGPIESDGSFFV